MTPEPQYSSFTLNANPTARAPKDENDKVPPSLRGAATVLVNGQPTEFEVAAWGPFPASTGGPDYYNLTLRPKDPALAARQVNTQLKPSDIPNPIDGFELTRVGSGKFFERPEDEIAMAKASGKNLPKFYGHVLVYTPAGPRAVDVAAWKREGQGRTFYSGNANVHDPKVLAAARAQSGRAATPTARRPQNG
jgi:hypothetical protein